MAKILHLDTATTWCSVAISENLHCLGVKEQNSKEKGKFIHSEFLHVFIDELCENCGIKLNELDAVCINIGPGSYTGLRIGMASAKGICAALNIPIISIDGLKAMTYKVIQQFPDFINYLPMIDARRMEVFTAVYDQQKNCIKATHNWIADEELLKTVFKQDQFHNHETEKYLTNFAFYGEGAEKFKDLLGAIGGEYITNVYQSAANLIPLAYKKFQEKSFDDLILLEPFYYKAFEAGKAKKLF